MSKQCLNVTDPYTGEPRQLRVDRRSVAAAELYRLRDENGKRIWSYDPGLLHTATGTSKITFLDGEKGELRYRGYAVTELVERSNYMETAYLLVRGRLPDPETAQRWRDNIDKHRSVQESMRKFLDGFRYDASPTGMLISAVAAMSTTFPDAANVLDRESRRLQTRRIIGKLPTMISFIHRSVTGQRFMYPRADLGYVENFLYMMFATREDWTPRRELVKALDQVFTVLADHGQTCATNVVRTAASSHADPYLALSTGMSVLAGRRHAGASDRTLNQLRALKTDDDIHALLGRVARGEGKLLGYGDWVFGNKNPRVSVLSEIADRLHDEGGDRELLDRARRLEKLASENEYIQGRGLTPNIDLYLGVILKAIGFSDGIVPIIITIPRAAGWLAHWSEVVCDQRIPMTRPRAIYEGPAPRPFVSARRREVDAEVETMVSDRI